MGLEMDNNGIDELVEEHIQELTTKELMELRSVSQQEVVEESLSEEEQVTAKQRPSAAIREILKVWETVASSHSLIRQSYHCFISSILIRQWLAALQIYLMIILCRIFGKF
ncbi:hypothetical protein AVEN_20844-1 [Araneus ventricosus]|uniref:Uncharacterized protein n=1 Tax=Araneus ventricosus TaxID=182803 RepID=A0A4Y2Q5I7_ARAVE|nr:hypothetical protein AVEN_20844-1 [Araneus ventricosus]